MPAYRFFRAVVDKTAQGVKYGAAVGVGVGAQVGYVGSACSWKGILPLKHPQHLLAATIGAIVFGAAGAVVGGIGGIAFGTVQGILELGQEEALNLPMAVELRS